MDTWVIGQLSFWFTVKEVRAVHSFFEAWNFGTLFAPSRSVANYNRFFTVYLSGNI
jgi:hypothetical protein